MKLPSGGRYWPTGSLADSVTDEHSVYAMTARDEIVMKQPDSLMNGQATVDVIKSCVPSIVNPWHMPSIDLDAVLVSIRIATYGSNMDMMVTVPKSKETITVQVDLNQTMEKLSQVHINDNITMSNGIIVKIKPLNYQQMSKLQLKSYEEQRMIKTMNDANLTEEQKLIKYQEIFSKLTNYNIETLVDSIESVTTPQEETVTDRSQIMNWVMNIDSQEANMIKAGMDDLRSQGSIKPITVQSPQSLVEQGSPATFETPITLDASNFFGLKSFRSRNLT
jgi:hypothetical protein